MINIEEIVKKLEGILNGTDQETISLENPTGFLFRVKAEGFHLDNIIDRETNKNFIPVFITNQGGPINAVPGLNEVENTIAVSLYYPVRFKKDFYAMADFLANCFVGKYLNWGTFSGKCVSNISSPKYGEIIDAVDLKQLKSWVDNNYREEINTNQAYMSMEFNLYLCTMSSGFVYGNDVNVSLTYNGTTFSPVFDEGSLMTNSDISAQQLIGASIPEIESLPVSTAYGSSFSIYYKNETIYNTILEKILDGKAQELELTLTIAIGTYSYTRNVFAQSINMPIKKGEPLKITFAFTKRI